MQSSRVLICDDDSVICSMIADVLDPLAGMGENGIPRDFVTAHPDQGEAYRLDFAHTGAEAIALLERALAEGDPYALVFMDVRLKGPMDGIAAIAQMWQLQPGVQVVLSSAYHDYSWDTINAVLGKSTDLLIMPKPFEIIALQQMAYVLCSKWELANRKEGDARTQQLADELSASKRQIDQLSSSRQWAFDLVRESENSSAQELVRVGAIDG